MHDLFTNIIQGYFTGAGLVVENVFEGYGECDCWSNMKLLCDIVFFIKFLFLDVYFITLGSNV